jgi:hypothetical protein
MTKALVTIEVDVNTWGFPVQEGLGESSSPQHLGKQRIDEGRREHIWDITHGLLKDKPEFVRVVKVSLIKERKVNNENL